MIKARVEVLLKPFLIPNFVGVGGGDSSLKLSEVELDVLSALCDEFCAGVFKNANKMDPRLED